MIPQAYPALRRFTPDEYLELERISVTKNEFVDGLIYATAGGTLEHARIIRNIDRELTPQFAGRGCETWSSDLKIAISASGPFFYPDLSVICGEPHLLDQRRDCAMNPVVVFEVLSKSTVRYDRTTKVSRFKEVASMRHIVLVSQDSYMVEHSYRDQADEWKVKLARGKSASVGLSAIDATLTLAAIYDKVHFRT